MSLFKAKSLVSILISIFFASCLTFSLLSADTETKHSKDNQVETKDSPTVKAGTPAKKNIRVAVLRDLPPLYVGKKASKKPTGFAIELLEKLSQIIGIKVTMVVVESWEDAINSLKAGDVDLIPGIAIIEDRKKEFIYSTEIVSVPVSFFVRAKDPDIKNWADLAGKKVAVIAKSAAEEALVSHPSFITIRMPNIETLLVSLLSSEVDAVLCPEYSMIKKASDIGVVKKIEVLGDPFFHLKRAYQFRKEDHLLRDQINKALNKYLQTEDYLYLYRKWYEPREFWIPLRIAVLVIMIIGIIAILTALLFFIRFLRTKKVLAEQKIHFQTLFETMSLGVIYQAADGRIISANPAAEKILGLTFEQMQAKTSNDPRWKMIREDGSEVPGEEHPAMIVLRTGQKVGPVVRGVFNTEKNTHIWLSITAIPLFEPGKTTPFQIYAIFDDITERKKAQEISQKLILRENFLFEAIPDIIMEVDNNKIYTWANEPGKEFFGNDVIGKEVSFYFEGEQNTYVNVVPIFRGNEEVLYLESWQRRKDGKKRLLAWWCRVLKDEQGNVTGALSSARDITEQKIAEEEIKKLNEELELRVAKRTAELAAKTAELERINKVFVDREMRMRELKKRVAELEKNSEARESGKDK
ncbi:MAG: transporter substrate-binding domain-containing protein [Syntrophaceae bacterium]|nr:transporter substrate-binding domain-containing protein [Syntrophaceae bacterium]